MRQFDTGATRDNEDGKLDYEGFLSPLVLARYAEYMHKNRIQADGTLRGSDNWQKGIPLSAYMKSGWRHFMDWWRMHRRKYQEWPEDQAALEEAICGVLFNAMGYLHEILRRRSDQSDSDTFVRMVLDNPIVKSLVDEGLTDEEECARVVTQRRSPWWGQEGGRTEHE